MTTKVKLHEAKDKRKRTLSHTTLSGQKNDENKMQISVSSGYTRYLSYAAISDTCIFKCAHFTQPVDW